jgi:dCTP deaminase
MPGQFAFLLTEETVRVPADAIALISMRVGYKFRGLINVSGFHVDPGFSGKLLFGVYNAGAKEIILTRREPLFLIVYADLDKESSFIYAGKASGRKQIDADLIEGMTGQVFSPMLLERQIRELQDSNNRLAREVAGVTGTSMFLIGITAIAIAIVIALFTTDTAKIWFGMVTKGALDAYEATVREQAKSLPLRAPTTSAPPATSGPRPTAVATPAQSEKKK